MSIERFQGGRVSVMATSHEDLPRHLISSASTDAVAYLNFVVELAGCVDVWTRMKQVHAATAEGFCSARICAKGGTGIAFMPWPCVTRQLADAASRAHGRSTGVGRGLTGCGVIIVGGT